ncbi:MAG: FAD-dependent oxidoreductase [Oscillospiraceae bacterium]|jgi:L-aspartate oxidase|nr:FAD-dependent oxidoreductase [Oscillospiraceae bacterium]
MDAYNVVIVGSGLAGLYAALHFADTDLSVLVLSKLAAGDSGSSLAQGGVAAVLEEDGENDGECTTAAGNTEDSFRLHYHDTLVAGHYLNNPDAVKTLVAEGPADVRRVMALGVEFDRDESGALLKTLEGGHSARRIVHHADQTGKEMVDKLVPQVKALPNVVFLENATCLSAQRADARQHAAEETAGFVLRVFRQRTVTDIFAENLLLCTGGIGQVYAYTTNPKVSTGDGIRLAYELGAEIRDISYVQFHPTAFRAEAEGEQFLISEAVRGEGAYLRNADGERFMERYDPRLELAPRDVVSRAILEEEKRVGSDRFYLDIRRKGKAYLQGRFPAIYAACAAAGVYMENDCIPVYPCQHYLMGGIHVDLEGRTNVPHLYAAGECAHTGLHGGNRLASNSLPEALVFSRRAAVRMQSGGLEPLSASMPPVPPPASQPEAGADFAALRATVRATMQKAYFVDPDDAYLPIAAKEMKAIYQTLRQTLPQTPEEAETHSLACVAMLVLEDAIYKRTEDLIHIQAAETSAKNT